MILAQAVAVYCALGTAPRCVDLVISFVGVATQAACEHAISVAEPSFLAANVGFRRLADSPIECEAVGGGGGSDA